MREYSCSLVANLKLKLSANEMEIIYGDSKWNVCKELKDSVSNNFNYFPSISLRLVVLVCFISSKVMISTFVIFLGSGVPVSRTSTFW